ncbi:MAG: helix-turn-helix domain-containing protein [Candidatus Bathyarchaeota archaeon]|nr:helix-turn-helix domain-containing protein [Candidatus Bathyarchaeota archaeon]
MVERAEALDIAEATLDQAGYRVSLRCVARTSCFDFAARKGLKLVFIKVFPDIRDVSREDAAGLKTLSGCFSGASLFISDTKEEKPLRNDTVYSRYGVHVVTSKTFDDVVRGAFPLIEATPGGYCVSMDGSRIRERRNELGLSTGKLAGMIGVSRGALYGYERDKNRVSVFTAYRMEEILGLPLVTTIDVFEALPKNLKAGNPSFGGHGKIRNRFLRFILSKLSQFDLEVSRIVRAPFDFAVLCPHVNLKIIGGVFKKREKRVKERIEEIVNLSGIVEARPLLVGQEKVATPDDVAFLHGDELAKIRNRKELAELL